MSDPAEEFREEVRRNAEALSGSEEVQKLSLDWMLATARHKYTYNFSWMGRPVIQFPQDLVAMQELIWRVQPDVIIETGIAHGGSLVFYSSMLELLGGDRIAIGIDIDIRAHNRAAIESHPMSARIRMVEGSSVERSTFDRVAALAEGRKSVLVALDSNHTHEHVLAELRLYSPLVTAGSYLVVFDTIVEQMPDDFFPDRPWGQGNNPHTAVQQFLAENDRFAVDEEFEKRLLITVAPGGYLKCLR
jgi:cephalosporin hydroxylase